MSIRVDKYEVWVTAQLSDDEKVEVARLLGEIAARRGSNHRFAAVASHTGLFTIDSLAPRVLSTLSQEGAP